MIRVKICGITREEDAVTAARAGADLIGMVFAPSPRQVDLDRARRIAARLASEHPEVSRVGVFADPPPGEIERVASAVSLTHLQIHGRAPDPIPSPLPWIAALAISRPSDARPPETSSWALLVESRVAGRSGGPGRGFPWAWARPLLAWGRVFIAGGLDAAGVQGLLEILRPYGVDASSALEVSPGIKDARKVAAFVDAVRRHDREEESR